MSSTLWRPVWVKKKASESHALILTRTPDGIDDASTQEDTMSAWAEHSGELGELSNTMVYRPRLRLVLITQIRDTLLPNLDLQLLRNPSANLKEGKQHCRTRLVMPDIDTWSEVKRWLAWQITIGLRSALK